MAFGMVIADRDEFYARGVVEPGFCWYVAAGPLLGSIGRDWFVSLPSGGLPVDFTRIGWKARIGAIVVSGRRDVYKRQLWARTLPIRGG